MLNKIFSITQDSIYKKIKFLGIKITFKQKEKAVAIIDCGGIGDYLLIRKYLKYFKISPRFSGYKLIYFSKKVYKTMLENYDKDIFDEVFVFSNKNFNQINKFLEKYSFEYMVNLYVLEESLNYLTAWTKRQGLIKKIKTKYKIADVIASETMKKNKNLKDWDELIVTEPNNFELERRRQFFEKLLDISIPKEDTNIVPLCDFKKDYIVISLLTNVKERNYSQEKWVKILNYIIQNTNKDLQLLFIGVDKDKKEAEKIINAVDDKYNQCKNIIGLNDISLLPSILSGAKFLLACETGTIHIAKAVDCKTICLSCGSYYNRFLPYENGVDYIYPDNFIELLKSGNKEKLQTFYNANFEYPMETIDEEKVIKVLDKYIKE